MDIYHGFFSLKPGISDVGFARDLEKFMKYLVESGNIASWRLMRRKLGLGPREFGEFHMMIEVENLTRLDEAFSMAAARTGTMEKHHFDVNSKIADVKFALYRDFPDPVRQTGGELF